MRAQSSNPRYICCSVDYSSKSALEKFSLTDRTHMTMLPHLLLRLTGLSGLQLPRQVLAAAPATVVGVALDVRHPVAGTAAKVVRYSSSEAKGTKRKKQKKRGKAAAGHSESSSSTIPGGPTGPTGDALQGTKNVDKGMSSHSPAQDRYTAAPPATALSSQKSNGTENAEGTLCSQDAPDFYTCLYIPVLGAQAQC